MVVLLTRSNQVEGGHSFRNAWQVDDNADQCSGEIKAGDALRGKRKNTGVGVQRPGF